MARKLAVALCLALLSACAPIDMNIEELLSPPRINERQTQVEQALGAHISLDSIQFQYPREGDYRSPFVFSDMDGDGLMEAVVFYTSMESGGGIRVKVLREEADGRWTLTDDRSGFGDRVHIVRFSNLLSAESQNLLIGWENGATGVRRLDVFSYRDGRLGALYQTYYTVFDIERYETGELEQIALVRQDSGGAYNLNLLGRTLDGRLSALGEAALSGDIYRVLNLTKGVMRENSNGIFVDARRFSDFLIATEIFEVADGRLLPLVADVDAEVINRLYRQTFRSDASLISLDLRRDGRVVIPIHDEEPLPGLVTEAELEPLSLTLYISYNHAGFLEVADRAVVNAGAGYLFFFPDRWVGRVTVERRPETGVWHFFEVNPFTNLPSAELLRIRVHPIRDYQDQHIGDYVHLADRGLLRYYGFIPNTTSELAISRQEMEDNFMLL